MGRGRRSKGSGTGEERRTTPREGKREGPRTRRDWTGWNRRRPKSPDPCPEDSGPFRPTNSRDGTLDSGRRCDWQQGRGLGLVQLRIRPLSRDIDTPTVGATRVEEAPPTLVAPAPPPGPHHPLSSHPDPPRTPDSVQGRVDRPLCPNVHSKRVGLVRSTSRTTEAGNRRSPRRRRYLWGKTRPD